MKPANRYIVMMAALLMGCTALRAEAPWWKETTVYQIYPRSFQDSDGDGIGDLAGIISRLDYIRDLGFETIWISPFFDSPQGDFGYDIRNYETIAREYGTMADADSLIAGAHRRGMRVVLDLVLNHTSGQHPWFQESRSSRDGDKADWYVWRDGRGKRPPNNWVNVFNKAAWHFDETRGQYYYTAFLGFQPDLNWRNPEVRQAMFDMVSFWMEKGADGFRLDIFNCIMEAEDLRDNPRAWNPMPARDGTRGGMQKKVNNLNHPDNIALARNLRGHIDGYPGRERFLVGEAIGDIHSVRRLVGDDAQGLNLVFLFDMIFFQFKAGFFRQKIAEFERLFPEPLYPTLVFGNHDNFRRSRRIGDNLSKDRVLTLFQLTARGVPFVYYGEEIGMTNAAIAKRDALDPISEVFGGLPPFLRNILPVPVNRDVCRTPMQWTAEAGAGFTEPGTTPWLPVAETGGNRNVAAQSADPHSLLNTFRDLGALRREHAAFRSGSIELLPKGAVPKNTLAYMRSDGDTTFLVWMNFSRKTRQLQLDGETSGNVMYRLNPGDAVNGDRAVLGPYGGLVLELPENPKLP